jgi:hypothetical protein
MIASLVPVLGRDLRRKTGIPTLRGAAVFAVIGRTCRAFVACRAGPDRKKR